MSKTVTRRDALELLFGTTTLIVMGCGAVTDTGDASAPDSSTPDADANAEAGACAATPEGEIGPYFADDSDPRFNRTNLTTNLDGTSVQEGIPLTLTIAIVDVENGCVPYANAQVDIWHCNAAGIYSDEGVENTTTETWLRGFQLTDANGRVTFQTIIPGWYQGRTTHIHLRVRSTYSNASSTSDGTNTTQLFFDQTFVDRLATTVAPYDAEGTNPTTNASDHVYSGETNGANLLTVAGDDTNGYAASVTIGLPIT
jgi:protocatechuate 3,4-dioxygenase beta subunit